MLQGVQLSLSQESQCVNVCASQTSILWMRRKLERENFIYRSWISVDLGVKERESISSSDKLCSMV